MTLIYITVIIPTLPLDKTDILSSIQNNAIPSSNTLFIVIFAAIGIADGVINRKMSKDKAGLKRRPILFTELKKMKIDCTQKEESRNPFQKAQRALRKLTILLAIKKATKLPDEIKENPLTRKFLSLGIFWVILHYMTYLHLVVLAKTDPNDGFWTAVMNFYNQSITTTNYAWITIRIFYLLSLCYVYVNISQIHYGQEIFNSCVMKWNMIHQVSHSVYDLIPFYREMGTLMDFLANRSSLQLRHKITINDITHYFWTARKEEVSRIMTGYGYRAGGVVKMSICLVWGILAAIIAFGPLLPFTSMFNFSYPVYIKDASMQVIYRDESGNDIGRIFKTQINIQNHDKNITEPYYKDYQEVRKPNSQALTKNLFELLTLSKASETISTIDDRFLSVRIQSNIDEVTKSIAKGSLVFKLNVQVILYINIDERQQNIYFLRGAAF